MQEYRDWCEGQPWVQELQEKLIKHATNLEAICRVSNSAPDDLDEFRRAMAAAVRKKRQRVPEDNDSEASTPAPSAASSPQRSTGAAAAGGAAATDGDDAPPASRIPTRSRHGKS